MHILRSIEELKVWRREVASRGEDVAFVPTMGFLHRGHQSLMSVAHLSGGRLLVSIFVNPLQFGAGEDFEHYPKSEAGDLAKVEEIDPNAAVFLPSVQDMYPIGFVSSVEVTGLTDALCGRSRPGHFKGVTTVVARLFGLVRPNRAYFGLKDYQQFVVIKSMVRDLAMGIEVVGVPIVREEDGLALSSRNVYLTSPQRLAALALSRGLARAVAAWEAGRRSPDVLVAEVRGALAEESLVREDYVEALDATTLIVPSTSSLEEPRSVVVGVAAYVGKARLIDNRVLEP